MLYHYHTGTMTMKSDGLNQIAPECFVEISPQDARNYEVKDGDTVEIKPGAFTLLLTNPISASYVDCEWGTQDSWVPMGWYCNVIAVDPVDPNTVWAAGVKGHELLRTLDGLEVDGITITRRSSRGLGRGGRVVVATPAGGHRPDTRQRRDQNKRTARHRRLPSFTSTCTPPGRRPAGALVPIGGTRRRRAGIRLALGLVRGFLLPGAGRGALQQGAGREKITRVRSGGQFFYQGPESLQQW